MIHKTDTREEEKMRKRKELIFMKKRIYYILGDICYHLRLRSACEYFWNKADAIAEAEYEQDVIDFYENGKGYYGRR